MDYPDIFEKQAFPLTMKSEVGPWFDPADPETQQGLCATRAQQKKTGYVNNKADKGGETKFGIAKNYHPDLDIVAMTLEDAKQIYFNEYWVKSRCGELPVPLNFLHFDAFVNSSPRAANKNLQRALKFSEAECDGVIGDKTIAAANAADIPSAVALWLKKREEFYRTLVLHDPTQDRFLGGWLDRVALLRTISTALMQ